MWCYILINYNVSYSKNIHLTSYYIYYKVSAQTSLPFKDSSYMLEMFRKKYVLHLAMVFVL